MALLLKRVERPRELSWVQAGALLYGDWGTSKAYVLGIAFALAGHASWFFLGLMSLLTALVGICYMIICRIYPDGGGVYSSVKHRSQLLAVIGALLLIADYVVTASISALDAFHYFGVPHPEICAIAAIVAIGALNWVGPTKAGSLAVVIGIAASVTAAILFLATLPSLPHVALSAPRGTIPHNWSVFVGIVLALSGVESIANMTGILKQPVEKTSKLAIWPVLLEVSVLTFLLGLAMNAVPGLTNHVEDMLRALATHYIGPWYGYLVSIAFGLLLLSATNTAIGAFANIQFALAKDKELPQEFAQLNRFGMPALALVLATAVPALVLVVEHNLVRLAALYAIGVVGAITLNIGAIATDFQLKLKPGERILFLCSAGVLLFIELTIAIQKRQALLFALTVLGTGLALRQLAKAVVPVVPAYEPSVNVLSVGEAKEIESLYRGSSLVAIKTLNRHLLDEAVLRAKALGENTIYVNYIEESPLAPELAREIEPSRESVELLAQASQEMEGKGITAIPVWQMGSDPGRLIAHAARELGVNTVMIGTTKRGALVNLLRGDVLRTLAKHLPRECHLVISG